MGGFSRKLRSCSALMAELWGILSALQLVTEIGYRKVILESDSAVTIDLIMKGCQDNNPCATIVSFINRLKMQEWEVTFQHTYRQANRVANWLVCGSRVIFTHGCACLIVLCWLHKPLMAGLCWNVYVTIQCVTNIHT
jgi:hypothetical protein